MNKSERKAYEWLKKKGYKKIVFYASRTPDFDTEEECFEVKRGYKLKTGEIKIIFEIGQREKIKDKEGKVLIFMDDDEPLDILKPDEIMESRVRDIILHDSCSEFSAPIRVNPVTKDKLKAIGSKGETYDDIINKNLMGKDIETRLLKELERLESKTDDPKVLKAINKIKELFKG